MDKIDNVDNLELATLANSKTNNNVESDNVVSDNVVSDNIIPDNIIVNTIENININDTPTLQTRQSLNLNQLSKLEADKGTSDIISSSLEQELDKKHNLSKGKIVDVKMIDSNSFKPVKIKDIVDDNDCTLFNIDFGNNIIEKDVHIDRIFLQNHSKVVKNSWDESKDGTLKLLLLKLKFNREVTRFYYYNVCKNEGFWSWALILIATFTSTITLANNVTEELFPYYFTLIKAMLTLWQRVQLYSSLDEKTKIC